MSGRVLQRVVVLGAGTMGARIAAHCANHGLEVALLDLNPAAAESGLQAALKSRPAAFFLPDLAHRVRRGGFDQHLDWVAGADWVIEAIIEQIEPKHALLARVEPLLPPHAALTTNTSGLPIAQVGAVLPPAARRRFFGTHFFNPPRYLRLVELIPTPETDPATLAWVQATLDYRLGKGVVPARDTPNFIANRIGAFALLNTLRLMERHALGVEEVDALTGPLLGWPKSATFRTLDLIGLDTLAHVVRNSAANLAGDERRELFQLPAVLERMIERNWLGDKTGQGFYRRLPDGQILALDLAKWEYQPRRHPRPAALNAAEGVEDAAARLRAAVRSSDAAGKFLAELLRELVVYAAARIPEIAPDAATVDRAMRWGYGWQWGPFELAEMLGLDWLPPADLPPYAARALAGTPPGFYRWRAEQPPRLENRAAPDFEFHPVAEPENQLALEPLRRGGRVRNGNASCSLIDLGEGVGCLEFHRKMNAIGGDIVALVTETLNAPDSGFDAFVIGNEAENFSAGADLLYLLLTIQNEDWDEVDAAVRAFQAMNLAVKRCPRPVVVAPAGLTLGGGCEMLLHAGSAVAHAELYTGLVEVGVGLIPAGGGTTQLALRASRAGGPVEVQDGFRQAFEAIALARVSTSAEEARRLGYLRGGDIVVANRSRLLFAARERARALAQGGYIPAGPETILAPGPGVLATLRWGVFLMREARRITEFESLIGQRLLHVLCCAGAPAGTPFSEAAMLDLEREAFLSLCGEPKTQERIGNMLKTGKALRN